jgi:hypothetical protein
MNSLSDQSDRNYGSYCITSTVKPEYNDHPRDPEMWPLLTCGRCSEVLLYSKCDKRDAEIVVVVERWSLTQV